jgi:hypothetical protein
MVIATASSMEQQNAYDLLPEGQEIEIEVTVLAVDKAPGEPPMLLVKCEDNNQLELLSATPCACSAARDLKRGEHVAALIAKCQRVISDRSYGGLRKQPVARVRFARLLGCRPSAI